MPSVNIVGVPVSPRLSSLMVLKDEKNDFVQFLPLQIDEGGFHGGAFIYRTSLSKLKDDTHDGSVFSSESRDLGVHTKHQVLSFILSSKASISVCMVSRAPKMLKKEYTSSRPLWCNKMMNMHNTISNEGIKTIVSAMLLRASQTVLEKIIDQIGFVEPQVLTDSKNQTNSVKTSIYAPKLRESVKPRHTREMSTVSCLSGKTEYDSDMFQSSLHLSPIVQDRKFAFPALPFMNSTALNLNHPIDEHSFDFKNTSSRDKITFSPLDDSLSTYSDIHLDSSLRVSEESSFFLGELHDSDMYSLRVRMYIKNLELKIEELKLQNDKLRHTMEYSTMQDRLLLEALKEAHREKDKNNNEIEKRFKFMEAKVAEYKQNIARLTLAIGAGKIRHKVEQLDDNQLSDISNNSHIISNGDKFKTSDSTCINSSNITSSVPYSTDTKTKHEDKNHANKIKTTLFKGRPIRRHKGGLHLNLFIKVD